MKRAMQKGAAGFLLIIMSWMFLCVSVQAEEANPGKTSIDVPAEFAEAETDEFQPKAAEFQADTSRFSADGSNDSGRLFRRVDHITKEESEPAELRSHGSLQTAYSR